jgi:hypothetical protein
VGAGVLQVETGFLLGFEGNGQFATRQILAPTTLLRYGVTKWIEARFVNQHESLKTAQMQYQGISDMQVGTKVQLLKKEDNPTEIALVAHVSMPTGSNGLASDVFGTINKLAVSHVLTDKIGLGYNIGYHYFGEGNGDLICTMSLAVGVDDKTGVYVEPYGLFRDMDEMDLYFDSGFTYKLTNHFQLDFSYGAGVNRTMNYMSVGFCWKAGE